MIRWNNDYNRGAHPEVLRALTQTNELCFGGYGTDECCDEAAELIKAKFECPKADVHFVIGGTQANFTVIAAALRPYQGVISALTGHINCHETGAVENCGHKIHALPAQNGKLSAEDVAREAENYKTSGVQEHITQPKMVYISFPTEYGTLYTKKELTELRRVCDEYNMYLFVDGARLAYGFGSPVCDVTPAELAASADVFYVGGTKCGAMFGEAIVIRNESLKDHFRSYIKQNGAMLAKGWLLGLQFSALLKNDLYFCAGEDAVKYALQIKETFAQKGIKPLFDSFTNQQFMVLTNEQMKELSQNHIYEFDQRLDEEHCSVRFCTGWATRKEDVETLLQDIKKL